MAKIQNLSNINLSVKLTVQDVVQYVQIMPRRILQLPEGAVVDPNFLARNPLVKVLQESEVRPLRKLVQKVEEK